MVRQIKNRISRAKSLSIYKKVRGFTMIDATLFADNLGLAATIDNLQGDIVECGVWRGGMIAGIAMQSKEKHKYILFDSFEGLPTPTEKDGKNALNWSEGKHPSTFYNNCIAEIDFAKDIMTKSGQHFDIVKGWFDDTIPNYIFDNPIALLRLDGDWYDSTIICLNHLFPKVATKGLVIIDDYYTWDGCSRAVHDYLSSISSVSRIRRTQNGVAYIVKLD